MFPNLDFLHFILMFGRQKRMLVLDGYVTNE